MLKNKNSKLLFYHFKNLLNQQLLWIQLLRRTIIAEDKKGLVELQKQKWPYFIDMLLIDAIYNFKICRYCYNVLYSSVAYNFFWSCFFTFLFENWWYKWRYWTQWLGTKDRHTRIYKQCWIASTCWFILSIQWKISARKRTCTRSGQINTWFSWGLWWNFVCLPIWNV